MPIHNDIPAFLMMHGYEDVAAEYQKEVEACNNPLDEQKFEDSGALFVSSGPRIEVRVPSWAKKEYKRLTARERFLYRKWYTLHVIGLHKFERDLYQKHRVELFNIFKKVLRRRKVDPVTREPEFETRFVYDENHPYRTPKTVKVPVYDSIFFLRVLASHLKETYLLRTPKMLGELSFSDIQNYNSKDKPT